MHYRSKLEVSCAKLFDELGINVEYEKHTYELIPKRKYLNELFRAVTYTPDFEGDDFIIECKGFPNDRWPVIKKLFIQYIEINGINKKFFEIKSISELKAALILVQTNLIEEWRPVVGFEKLYEVSNYGNVRSLQFHGKKKIKLMSLSTDKLGYKFVKLRDWHNNISGSFPVHRLVAKAFIDNPENKEYIDHVDTNPSNNIVTNLRWVTHLENQNNPITLERLKKSLTNYNKSEAHKIVVKQTLGIPVIQYDKTSNEFIAEYPSITDAAIALNTTACCVKRVCDGERKYHRNWIFRYKNNVRI